MRPLVLVVVVLFTGCSKTKEQPEPKAASDPRNTPEAKRRLEKVGAALQAYANKTGHFPAGVMTANNNVGLSWRVQILPYMGYEDLYKQFDLKEPYDSDRNHRVSREMPNEFATPALKGTPGYTHLRSFVAVGGPHKAVMVSSGELFAAPDARKKPLPAGFELKGRTPAAVKDGVAATLFVAEVRQPVPWAKPDEVEYDPTKPLPKLGAWPDGGFVGLTGDSRAHLFPENLSPDALRALVTIDGAEVLPADVHDLIRAK